MVVKSARIGGKGVIVWRCRVCSGINGTAANVSVAGKHVTNSTIGMVVSVNVAEKCGTNNIHGHTTQFRKNVNVLIAGVL
jgi:hypothetical protein